jgi:lysozyme
LQPAKDAGILGVIHKLTEGSTVVDPKVKARYGLAKDAGMLFGLYHFLRPGDIEKQAAFFLMKAGELGVLDDDTLIACDFEVEGITLVEVLHFLQAIARGTQRSPVL